MSARDELPEHVRVVIDEAAERIAAQAPPPKPWQIAVLAPLFAPVLAGRKDVA